MSSSSHTETNASQEGDSDLQQESAVKERTLNPADSSTDDDFVDLTDFFILLQRREWQSVYEFLVKNPQASRQTIHSKNGTTHLLHNVLRHGPPLPVLNALLANIAPPGDKTGNASSSIWKQLDTNGRLPLHAACSCGPDASLDVITKLISADPEALQTRTKDHHQRFPLHLAVLTNASEDVVMELIINYPDASFRPDSHGKIPLEYAQDSCYGHNRLVVALEWAPMFLAAAQAAYNRVIKASEQKLNSLREAHASYVEQLEERLNSEKLVLVEEQIQCSNDLTNEKERNIALAEAMLELKESEKDLIREKEALKSKFDREVLIKNIRMKMRDNELRKILFRKQGNGPSKQTENNEEKELEEKEDKETSEKEEQNEAGAEANLESISNSLPSDLPLPRLLGRMSDGYESSKRRNEMYKKCLERQRATARKLNELLSTKESELNQANRKSRADAFSLQAAIDRAEDLSAKHESTLVDLAKAREEAERLKRIGLERDQKLAHSERRLKIQEKRLSGVQDLIESFKAAKAIDDDRLDLIQEETDRELDIGGNSNKLGFGGSASATTNSSTILKPVDLSVDLSVEIEMAAMAAAHLDDSINSHEYLGSREADLSAELADNFTKQQSSNWEGDNWDTESGSRGSNWIRDTIAEVARSDRENQYPESESGATLTKKEANIQEEKDWKVNKWEKQTVSTPQTLSSSTVTTASRERDYFSDYNMAIGRNTPETPTVPEQVDSRCRREYDYCSPLATPKLDFTRGT